MNNYIKCKYKVDFSEEVLEKIDAEWEKLTYLCEPINKKHGDFLIRSNGELCHNIVEYEEVGLMSLVNWSNMERNNLRKSYKS